MGYQLTYSVAVRREVVCDKCGEQLEDSPDIVDWDQPDGNPVIIEEWGILDIAAKGWSVDDDLGAICPKCA